MKHINVQELPALRNPFMLVAFAGWNDAAEAATSAARVLIGKYEAKKFAEYDAEEFYDFTSTRPLVRVGADFQRQLEWPLNAFYSHSDPTDERDAVIVVGVEPHLKWRAFTDDMLELARQCGVSLVVTLGAMLTDTPHSRPVPLIGFATEPNLISRLREFHIGPTHYQGPTGILGAIHDACLKQEMPAISVWASVPHYLGVAQNPKAAAALLRTVDNILDLSLDLDDLDRAAQRFESQVDAIVSRTPEAAAYVQELERRADTPIESENNELEERPELPPSDTVIRDLEEFLRRRRPDSNGSETPEE